VSNHVYKHFGDKRRMFIELLTGDMGSADATVAALAETVPDSQDLETDLRAFARVYLAAVKQPHLIRLRRVVIGEAERFPEIAGPGTPAGQRRRTRRSPSGSRHWTGEGCCAPTTPSLPPGTSTG
jgi:AcrR family transcriptional regulator